MRIRPADAGTTSIDLSTAVRYVVPLRPWVNIQITHGFKISTWLDRIDETLSEESMKKIEDAVREGECVISAGVPAGNMHMMLVAYTPECVSATDILARVENAGVHAELVGM